MSIYKELDAQLLELCSKFYKVSNAELKELCVQFNNIADKIVSIDDNELRDNIESIYGTFNTYWYFLGMDIAETEDGYNELKKEISKYVNRVEKIIDNRAPER